MMEKALDAAKAPYLERLDTDGNYITIPSGITSFGRGPFLKCKEKKISRNHGLLELTSGGQVFITSIHSTPVYVRAGGTGEPRALVQNKREPLSAGDEFRLLPDTFCYRLCRPEAATSGLEASASVRPPAEGARDAMQAQQTSVADGKMVAGTSAAAEEPAGMAESATMSGSSISEAPTVTGETVVAEPSAAVVGVGGTRASGGPSTAAAAAAVSQRQTPNRAAQVTVSSSATPAPEPSSRLGAMSGKDVNGTEKVTSTAVNGCSKRRKLPAFLLDLDSAADDSASAAPKKKRTPASGAAATSSPGGAKQKRPPATGAAAAGSSPGGGRRQRATPGGRGGGSPRGRKQRPSEREQLSQLSDEEIPPPPAAAASPKAPAPAVSADPTPPPPATGDTAVASDPPATADTSAASVPAASSSAPPARQVAAQSSAQPSHVVSDDSDDEVLTNNIASSSQRESCAFGDDCFRTNPAHRREFAHPGDADYAAPATPAAGQPLPECEFGLNCYRKNPMHRRQFRHTSRPNPRREAKRKARQQAQQAAGDTPDSYDLDDPFIDDSDSDDYAPDGSGSDWSADEGSGSDEDDRRRRAKEARRLTGRR